MQNSYKTIGQKINDYIISIQKIKVKEKLIFYRLLSTMINAGIGLVKSMTVLENQEKNPVFKKMLGVFRDKLKLGQNLSECIDLYPSSFGISEVGIIKSGEKTGKLNEVLLELAEQIEKVSSISGKIKSAMMYPIFILFVVIGVVGVMMVKVVPKLLEIFDDESKLPTSTKTLKAVSDFFINHWYVLILLVIFCYIFTVIWGKTINGRYNIDKIKLHIPVFGKINQLLILSKFSRIFSGLISSGISIIESLKIVSDAVGNDVYKQRILLLREDVKQGIKIWESLDGDELFPEMMVQMIQVGEQTAKLDKTILKVADFYDEQVDNTISVINKLLEPFIIVLLAIVVGGIAVAIMEPIMALSDIVSES
ncbi:hypothetical protein CSB08_01045 [Candidatus Gracilibacteria bacterium]|nr:MAG: hypothetical protein CSB08_01045 [Candidatus Gracilibacteria bacterium]